MGPKIMCVHTCLHNKRTHKHKHTHARTHTHAHTQTQTHTRTHTKLTRWKSSFLLGLEAQQTHSAHSTQHTHLDGDLVALLVYEAQHDTPQMHMQAHTANTHSTQHTAHAPGWQFGCPPDL